MNDKAYQQGLDYGENLAKKLSDEDRAKEKAAYLKIIETSDEGTYQNSFACGVFVSLNK